MLSHNTRGGLVRKNFSSRRRAQIQDSSAAVWAKDLYSDSVEERATEVCFLALHEIRLLPRKIQNPVVER